MQIETIITLASKPVELLLRTMVRSLRATGCALPVRVIPYNDSRFELPENCEWWEVSEFVEWIDRNGKRPVMRKYQVLLAKNYLFADTDIIFLRNPQEVLLPHSGFITCCGHWHNPGETTTAESIPLLRSLTTNWPSRVFNSGQFACDQQLYTVGTLRAFAEDVRYRSIVLGNPFHEQAGMNILVNLSGTSVTNLTLPPHNMESTWAGDYDTPQDVPKSGSTRDPFLLHWAGVKVRCKRAIDILVLQWMSPDEKDQFKRTVSDSKKSWIKKKCASVRRRLSLAWKGFNYAEN